MRRAFGYDRGVHREIVVDAMSLDAAVRATVGATRVVCDPRAHGAKSRLVQATREDLDAVVADNLARAAAANGFEIADGDATVLVPPPADTRSTVLSIQRLALPRGRSAAWAAREYPRWCDRALGPVRAIVEADETVRLRIRPSSADVLVLSPLIDEGDRYAWRIAGGVLAAADQRGTFELREIAGALFAIVHDFEPSLPWWIYRVTEAPTHVRVMHAFGRAIARAPAPDPRG
jgi:hypothetical protein